MTPTLVSLATAFLNRSKLSASTIYSYESTLLPLLQQYGRSPVDTLTRQQIEGYLNSLQHLSCNTHNRHQTIIQSLFNFAVEQEYISNNPIARLKHRKPDRAKDEQSSNQLVRYLNPQQLELLYSLLEPASRLHTLVLLLHQTGVKIAEALALNLEDIDRVDCKFRVVGKGNKQRWCFYDEDFAQVLETHIRLYRHPHPPVKSTGDNTTSSQLCALFTAQQPYTQEITRLSYSAAYKDWINLVRQNSELERFRLNDLRHTFATERVGLMSLEELSALLGHSNTQTVLQYQKIRIIHTKKVAKEALKILTKSKDF
jgi:integrase/recombinase XerD